MYSASLTSLDSSPANALGASLGRGLLDASLFHVEDGVMGGINGTSDALWGSRSHKHIRVDCYELFCTTLGAI